MTDRDGLDDETDEEEYQGVCELAPAAGCFAGLFDGESLLFGGSKEGTWWHALPWFTLCGAERGIWQGV